MLLYEVWTVSAGRTYAGDYYLLLCETDDIETGIRMAIKHCKKHYKQLPEKVVFLGKEEK